MLKCRPRITRRPTACAGGKRRSIHNGLLSVNAEVQDALKSGRPVVALESAIITHGLPTPINFQTAQSVERIVRATGCVPATIALLSGRVHIGLTESQLKELSDVDTNHSPVKLSRRDLGAAIALRKSGGTTIAGTMILAHLAGIHFFATGGLGGVHRGGETSFDISADLTELSRTPVAVVAAGVKAILDIGRTLEYLETQGVPVVTFGATDDFPAFYAPSSGFKSPWHVQSPLDAARIVYSNRELNLDCGTFFGVPIPDSHAGASSFIQQAVEQAVEESVQNGMSKRGKEVTPWLLRRVAQLTKGTAIESNIALIENSALVAGKIASAYSTLSGGSDNPDEPPGGVMYRRRAPDQPRASNRSDGTETPSSVAVAIVGAAAIDVTARSNLATDFKSSSTIPGTVRMSLGGVARNIAEATHRILNPVGGPKNTATLLVSPVGNDVLAEVLKNGLTAIGQRVDGLVERSSSIDMLLQSTAVCNMVLDEKGNLVGGVADMDIVEGLDVKQVVDVLSAHNPRLVAFDGNLRSDVMGAILSHCHQRNACSFFEPTSVAKCTRVFSAIQAMMAQREDAVLTFMSPNVLELQAMYDHGHSLDLFSTARWWKVTDRLALDGQFRNDAQALSLLPEGEGSGSSMEFLIKDGILQMATKFLPFVRHLFIKLGARGLLVVMRLSAAGDGKAWNLLGTQISNRLIVSHGKEEVAVFKHFPADALPSGAHLNVTGAGDTLVGALLAGLLQMQAPLAPQELDRLARRAQRAALITMQSDLAVSPDLNSVTTASV